jgi:preflagellin peptidase FlaK
MIFTLLAISGAIVASYTDLKHGIIQNKLTMSLFSVGFFGHLILDGRAIFLTLLSSVVLIFLVGYGFWLIGGWSAGDAKEFLFLAALLPKYPASLEGIFDPVLGSYPFIITIFINTFLAIFPFILLWGVFTAFKRAKINELLAPLKNLDQIGTNTLVFASAVLLTILFNVTAVFALPIVLAFYLVKNARVKVVLSLIVVSAFIAMMGNPLFVLRFIAGIFAGIMVFRLFWNSISIVRSEALHDTIWVKDLEEGMVLSQAVYDGENKIETRASGLTKEDITRLKELEIGGKVEEIKIKKTIPFAPVIFIGLLISLGLGDIVMVVRNG